MAAMLRRPWDDNDNTEKDIKKDTEKDIDRKAISEQMHMAVLNVHQYSSQNGGIPGRIKETSKAFKLHRYNVECSSILKPKWRDSWKNKRNQQSI